MCCSTGGCDREVRICERCGKEMPPRKAARGRPAKYCSSKCRRGERRPLPCARQCQKCGVAFASRYERQFCSESCRWPTFVLSCVSCGGEFSSSHARTKCCSRACARNARGKQPKTYACLRCGNPFRRKRFPGGSTSCGKKYCSRDCAFAARREKLPCAARPTEQAAKCRRELERWRRERERLIAEEADRWMPNRPPPGRLCPDCESSWIYPQRGRRCCAECSKHKRKAARRRNRRRIRRLHGGDNHRKRCRRYGAPYTPIKNQAIYDRDGWACQLCGVELLRKYLRTSAGIDPRSPTLDHIIPLCLGPDSPGHVESNVQAACWDCNTRRGAAPIDSFAAAKRNSLP